MDEKRWLQCLGGEVTRDSLVVVTKVLTRLMLIAKSKVQDFVLWTKSRAIALQAQDAPMTTKRSGHRQHATRAVEDSRATAPFSMPPCQKGTRSSPYEKLDLTLWSSRPVRPALPLRTSFGALLASLRIHQARTGRVQAF